MGVYYSIWHTLCICHGIPVPRRDVPTQMGSSTGVRVEMI